MAFSFLDLCVPLGALKTFMQIGGFFLILVIGYFCYQLIRNSSKSYSRFQKTVLAVFIIILLSHTVLDFYVLLNISEGTISWVGNLIIAILHSFELFLLQTHLFDNGYQEYLFGGNSGLDLVSDGHPFIVFLYVASFVLAAITSGCFLIRILSRRDSGRTWLRNNLKETVFVFFGGDKRARLLAEDLKATKPEVKLLYVAEFDPETENIGLSVWDIIRIRLLKKKPESFAPFDAVVFSKVPLKNVDGENICAAMGMEGLSEIMGNKACRIFLLSDETDDNLHCASVLQKAGCKAEIYCRACRQGVNRIYEETLSMTPEVTVHIVDESYLAVSELSGKDYADLLPVNFVDKGKDEHGRSEGWVESEFNSLVLGFGELGQGILGFLYEYGSFVGQDFKKSPFCCTVLDKDMDLLERAFRVRYPGMDEKSGVVYGKCEVGSNDFWTRMESLIKNLNYIVVCLGNDRLNLNVASEILSLALRMNKDLTKNFAILVAQLDSDYLNEVAVRHLNSIPEYHKCVHSFGGLKSVWREQVINNADLDGMAKNYYASYKRAEQGGDVDMEQIWMDREQTILCSDNYKKRMNAIRQRSQDYANVLHSTTKLALLGPEILERRAEIAGEIPLMLDFKSEHYSGTDEHVGKVLHYLAVLEHIRWEASHVAMGYVPGTQTDAVKKTHKCIKSFDDLDPKTQHYDYLVVRVTFSLF